MDSSSIAFRLKQSPRFLAIHSPYQLHLRLQKMTPLQIWEAMSQRGIAGWKHKIMSDELESRKHNVLFRSGFFPFIKEGSS
jgi:hypothetical protein